MATTLANPSLISPLELRKNMYLLKICDSNSILLLFNGSVKVSEEKLFALRNALRRISKDLIVKIPSNQLMFYFLHIYIFVQISFF